MILANLHLTGDTEQHVKQKRLKTGPVETAIDII